MPDYRVGIDIGGTFTDIVFLDDDGAVIVKKVSSSVGDYARAIVRGLEEILDEHGLTARIVSEILHGTTVASNAILELQGARVGLIGSAGFRDVLELRNLRMPRLYDLAWHKPPPLVPRHLRMTVTERVNARGEVLVALDPSDAGRAIDRLAAEGVDAIAVCLINSYANPVHERLIARVAAERAPDLPCCISFDVLPEIKEYERTSTTVVNTYVMPIVRHYLRSLESALTDRRVEAPLLLMQSNGGLMPAAAAAERPVNIVESGPAGGVVGTQALASRLGVANVISFDMGGTTAKASLIEAGAYTRTKDYSVGGGIMIGSRLMTGGGYLLGVPAIDLAEVGAGGGSIIWLDAGGSLQVGPRSAGAEPGPVCYGLGGTRPTITDANMVLGYLNPEHLCGGQLPVDLDLSKAALAEHAAGPLGLELAALAYGARQVAVSNMIRAIRAVSTERGRDPREYALVAFGGNGPLFAADMAAELGMRRVAIPPAAGLFSAFGLLYADVEHHYSRTVRAVTRDADPAALEAVFRELEAAAAAQLEADGFDRSRQTVTRSATAHYKGQIYELAVPLGREPLDRAALDALAEAFAREHERTYGHRAGPEEPVEIVNAEVAARAEPERPRIPDRLRFPAAARVDGSRDAYFGPEHGWLCTPVLSRANLAEAREGPCIVEDYDSTCLVPPGASVSIDDAHNIILDL